MVRLTQELLRPGAYHLANGRTGRLTREDLARVASTTLSLLKAGYEIPLLKKHATQGAPHGGPRKPALDSDDHDAQRVGRVADLTLHDDGSLHQILEIDDEATAQEFMDGEARHTSAELRPTWTDEEGHEHGPLVAHVALTKTPRHTSQPPAELLVETVQFSLEEIEGVASQAAQAQFRDQIEGAKIPAGLRKRIWETLTARQFSAERDEPTLALSEVLSILETGLPPQWRQTFPAQPAAHAAGDAFFSGEDLSDERAEQIARDQVRRGGFDR